MGLCRGRGGGEARVRVRQGERVRRMDGNGVNDPAVLLRETGGRDATRVHERDVTLTKSRRCLRKKDMSLLFIYFSFPRSPVGD